MRRKSENPLFEISYSILAPSSGTEKNLNTSAQLHKCCSQADTPTPVITPRAHHTTRPTARSTLAAVSGAHRLQCSFFDACTISLHDISPTTSNVLPSSTDVASVRHHRIVSGPTNTAFYHRRRPCFSSRRKSCLD